MSESVDDPCLDFASTNARAIGAGSLPSGSGAGDVILADRCGRPAANAANRFSGQEMSGTTASPELRRASLDYTVAVSDGAEPRLDAIPEIVIYDPQLGHITTNPVLTWIDARNPPSRRWILAIAQSIPDEPPNIELIAQDARPAQGVAADRRVAP